MRVALIGGTGTFGRGMALRLAVNNDVLIGSRDPNKATNKALELSKLTNKTISGDSNAAIADAILISRSLNIPPPLPPIPQPQVGPPQPSKGDTRYTA
jgi:predicted dinucleotide-binding enzyme